MKSSEIRNRFLKFFEGNNHAIIPSASLVTPDEKGVTNSTLFNTAGMQPLVPYLLGKEHPKGKRLADVQKCLRTVDFDDIGDRTHATFFEMLGNWSLGDYFKKEAISWSYEFLTSKDKGLGLDPRRLYVTVFEGDENAPRDNEAASIWKDIFAKNQIEGNRIFYLPAKNNWWEAGDNGPCGPDTEMYYDIKNIFGGKGLTHEEFLKADENRDVIEVWNDVFMQYEKKDGKIIGKLPKPSVDTGAGLERLAMTLQGVDNLYDTDLFKNIIDYVNIISPNSDIKSKRIISDHIRSSVFLITDGVVPANVGRGYVLRRLIRRSVFSSENKFFTKDQISRFVDIVSDTYKEVYPEIKSKNNLVTEELFKEVERFDKTLANGLNELGKIFKLGKDAVTAEEAFMLYSSYGFPIDLIVDHSKPRKVDVEGFHVLMHKHQELSRAGAEQKFKGGLAGTGEIETRYHTATHLLHQALRDVLGTHVQQKGSNITAERMRFDFVHNAKMTDEEKKKVESIVNEKIQASLPVVKIVLPKEEALKTGALHFFAEKYGDEVSVYYIGENIDKAYSKEFCGGPHVSNTKELGKFTLQKEEAVSAGVRRIKAILN